MPGLSERAVAVIRSYPWPGNVRELSNAMCRAVVSGRDPIEPEGFQLPSDAKAVKLPPTKRKLTREDVRRAVKATGSVAGAAKLLKKHRATLHRNFPGGLDL